MENEFEMQQAGAFASSSDSSSIEDSQSEHKNDQDSLRPPEQKEVDSASAFSRQSKMSHISYVPLADYADLDLSYEEDNEIVKMQSMKMRENCVISQENRYKSYWDMWIIVVLFFVAITLPYRIAFSEKDSTTWQVINYIVDSSFAVDMVLTFFTTIPDPENNTIITSKKTIALAYIKSWFFVDLISIIPIDKFIASGTSRLTQLTKFSRFTRFSRLVRLFRIIRMAKMFRICKDRKRIQNRAGSMVKLDPNMERIMWFLVIIMFINHVLACLWVIAAKVDDEMNWIKTYEEDQQIEKMKDGHLYLTSFYFVSTTVTTVGYGDITARNGFEMVLAIIILFVGVMTFSFASGSLSSMITNFDNSQLSLKQKLDTLEKIRKQYNLPPSLYVELQSSIKFEYSKRMDGLGDFMLTLPLSLKCKLAQEIHKDVTENFTFFRRVKEKSFLSWVGHRLLPRMIHEKQYLYQETEELNGFYFIKEGDLAFVLANFDNAIYKKVSKGRIIGFEDYSYFLNMKKQGFDSLDALEHNQSSITRKFTVISRTKVQALELPTLEIIRIGREFPAVAELLYKTSEKQLGKLLKYKIDLQNRIKHQQASVNEESHSSSPVDFAGNLPK